MISSESQKFQKKPRHILAIADRGSRQAAPALMGRRAEFIG